MNFQRMQVLLDQQTFKLKQTVSSFVQNKPSIDAYMFEEEANFNAIANGDGLIYLKIVVLTLSSYLWFSSTCNNIKYTSTTNNSFFFQILLMNILCI